MSLLVQDQTMPKKKHGGTREGAGRPPTGRDDVAVKIDRALASQARAVAQYLGIPVGQVMTEAAATSLAKMYAKMLRELDEKQK